ncbi:MAG: fumarylacetoacetate hydrolase family protein [Dehalococcoidales bacterium]|nr:MAG: fumarylacetoacetate hydrolase family protein [Dehalococcoidales bacterium]
MKLLFFDNYRLGALKEDNVIDLSDFAQAIPHADPNTLISKLIESYANYREELQRIIDSSPGVSVNQVSIRSPLPRPANIDCMAVNYMENGTLTEKPPFNAFQKSPGSIIGNGDTMILPDVPATIFEGEAELGVVIGKRASHVKAADAMNYVFGYINFIDGSARGLPSPINVFYQMKSRDTFAPIGPCIVTADEISDPHNLAVKLWNNGILMQDFNTSDMANKIPECIEWISSIHTLEPGDIVATGTNHGGLNPFQDGDSIEMEIEGLGRLNFKVRDDLKRTWARETRFERQQKGLEGFTPQLTGKYANS